mmetsp:Transcript_99689/g.157796  ORF Transcript_99689/g.157796 Transcript_99689/m.157796 type:complete len:92 (+) Transcript_99689:182-457(+)
MMRMVLRKIKASTKVPTNITNELHSSRCKVQYTSSNAFSTRRANCEIFQSPSFAADRRAAEDKLHRGRHCNSKGADSTNDTQNEVTKRATL